MQKFTLTAHFSATGQLISPQAYIGHDASRKPHDDESVKLKSFRRLAHLWIIKALEEIAWCKEEEVITTRHEFPHRTIKEKSLSRHTILMSSWLNFSASISSLARCWGRRFC